MNRAVATAAILSVTLVAALSLAQDSRPTSAVATSRSVASQAAPVLTISGLAAEPKSYSADQFRSLPRTSIKVRDKDGNEVAYEGVRAKDALIDAGMQYGRNLRGERLSDYLLVEGRDGYRVAVALTETDEEFSDRVVLIAEKADGKPLSAEDGPLRLIVSDERKHARWVRGVTRVSVEHSRR